MRELLVVLLAIFIQFFLVCVCALIICLPLAGPFMWLWNYAVVFAISGVAVLDYWHAYWLLVFVAMFLGGVNASNTRAD